MRNSILFVCFFLAVQFSSAQQSSLGIRAGYNRSDFVIKNFEDYVEAGHDPNDDFEARSGFHIGLEGRWALKPRWALLGGAVYNQKGFLQKGYVLNNATDVEHILHYLNLPLVVDYNVWQGLSLQAGLEAGWFLSAQGKAGGESFDLEGFADLYSDFDLGLVAGLEYRLGKGFFAGARYTWGIYDVQNGVEFVDQNNNVANINSYNRALQISAGYRYTFAQ